MFNVKISTCLYCNDIFLCCQFMSEKIGSAKGSKLDDDFLELERVRNVVSCSFYLQTNNLIFNLTSLTKGNDDSMNAWCRLMHTSDYLVISIFNPVWRHSISKMNSLLSWQLFNQHILCHLRPAGTNNLISFHLEQFSFLSSA